MAQDDDKQAAARAAADEVRDGMLVGLGTGTTAAFLIDELGRRVADGLRIEAVATSEASAARARLLGIPVHPMDAIARVDLAIDGVDEIDDRLRAIKGAGGAMLREKVVAAAAARMVAIADGSKRVARLGAAPVPVEVVPFATAFAAAALRGLGAEPLPRVRDGAPWRTDGGNGILDCRFVALDDPAGMAAAIAAIPGVVGHGLFLDEIDAVYVATDGGVARYERPAAP